MSDEQYEDEKPTTEDLVDLLHNDELLAEEGYRLTPKGHMALVMMEHGFPDIVAEALSEVMSNRIFLAGWTYLDQDQVTQMMEGGTDAV